LATTFEGNVAFEFFHLAINSKVQINTLKWASSDKVSNLRLNYCKSIKEV